jgi:hypothetical protein
MIENVTGLRWPRPTPSNNERLRQFRARQLPPVGNEHDWPHCKAARYAREQSPQAALPYSERRG